MDRQEKLAMLGALCGNSIFGFSFMFSRMALQVAPPSVLLMYRFVLAAAVLLLIAVIASRYGERTADSGGIHWLRFSLKGKPLLPLVALGVVQPVIYFLCESYGIRMKPYLRHIAPDHLLNLFQNMLNKGLITPEQYAIIDTKMLEKYQPLLGTLFATDGLTI